MLAELYEIKAQFPLVFGAVVCAFGIALLVNAKLVLRFGMVSMVNLGLAVSGVVQLTLIGICLVFGSAPFFWLFGYLFLLLFSLGLIFGNLTALILEPMGDMAGVASAISSAISTSVALVISAGMGYVFAGELLQFIVPVAAVSVFAAGMFFTALSRSESPEYS